MDPSASSFSLSVGGLVRSSSDSRGCAGLQLTFQACGACPRGDPQASCCLRPHAQPFAVLVLGGAGDERGLHGGAASSSAPEARLAPRPRPTLLAATPSTASQLMLGPKLCCATKGELHVLGCVVGAAVSWGVPRRRHSSPRVLPVLFNRVPCLWERVPANDMQVVEAFVTPGGTHRPGAPRAWAPLAAVTWVCALGCTQLRHAVGRPHGCMRVRFRGRSAAAASAVPAGGWTAGQGQSRTSCRYSLLPACRAAPPRSTRVAARPTASAERAAPPTPHYLPALPPGHPPNM